MENKLKPETPRIIRSLTRSNIRPIMCTGDNLLTAISVARECGMLNRSNKVTIDSKSIANQKKASCWTTSEANANIVIVEADSRKPNLMPRFVLVDDDGAHSDEQVATNFSHSEHDDEQSEKSASSSLGHDQTQYQLLDGKISQLHLAINGSSFDVVRKYYPDVFELLMRYGS